MYYAKPFNYVFDGALTRTTHAWFHDGDLIRLAAANERRTVEVLTPDRDRWVWIEGARENVLLDPLDMRAGTWTDQASGGPVSVGVPTGASAMVAIGLTADVVGQPVALISYPIVGTGSVYARSVSDGAAFQLSAFQANAFQTSATPSAYDLSVTNSGGGPSVHAVPPAGRWLRSAVKAKTLSVVGTKSIQFDGFMGDTYLWGACFETAPGYTASARFPSQPILETGTRANELFEPGIITAAMLAQGPRSVRVTFRPEFGSGDVVAADTFVIVAFDAGNPGTMLSLRLEGVGAGDVRARAGFSATFAGSGALTFVAGQRLTMELVLATGALTVSGCSAGNGTFANSTYAIDPVSVVAVGSRSDSTLHAYSLIGPVELGFDPATVLSIDQLTLTSARLTFSAPMRQFDANGILDALNPDHYEVTGSPGVPPVQLVESDTASSVILHFQQPIAQGALVRVRAHDIVTTGTPPIGLAAGERPTLDLFTETGGVLDTVIEYVGEGPAVCLFSTWAGASEHIDEVSTITPWFDYYFVDGATTVAKMEAAINSTGVFRVAMPGTNRIMSAVTDQFEQMGFTVGSASPTVEFIGFGAEQTVQAQAQQLLPRVDIANPQTPSDAGQGASLGTFQITDAGDLANDSGRAYLKKRIWRRLTTAKGGFFHLKDYGLEMPVKNLFTSTRLRRLQVDIERQVREEPGVVTARASVRELSPGIVAVKLVVADDNGSFETAGTLDFLAE